MTIPATLRGFPALRTCLAEAASAATMACVLFHECGYRQTDVIMQLDGRTYQEMFTMFVNFADPAWLERFWGGGHFDCMSTPDGLRIQNISSVDNHLSYRTANSNNAFRFESPLQDLWVHLLITTSPMLGANMYTHLFVDDKLTKEFLIIGKNGMQHWTAPAVPSDKDGLFFCQFRPHTGSSNASQGVIWGDYSLELNKRSRHNTTRLYSCHVRYPTSTSSGETRLFIDGYHVGPPNGSFTCAAEDLPHSTLSLRCAVQLDRDWDYQGRYDEDWKPRDAYEREVYAAYCPNLPVRRPTIPRNQVDAAPLWQKTFSLVRTRVQGTVSGDIENHEAYLFNLKNVGRCDPIVAVVLGGIKLHPANHSLWTGTSNGYEHTVKILSELCQSHGVPMLHDGERAPYWLFAKDLALSYLQQGIDRCENFSALAVDFGCLTAPELRNSGQWVYVNGSEKALVPNQSDYSKGLASETWHSAFLGDTPTLMGEWRRFVEMVGDENICNRMKP